MTNYFHVFHLFIAFFLSQTCLEMRLDAVKIIREIIHS